VRTARLIVLIFLVMAAVPGSALAQKECEDELGNTRTSYRSTATRRACSRAVSAGRRLESHRTRSPHRLPAL